MNVKTILLIFAGLSGILFWFTSGATRQPAAPEVIPPSDGPCCTFSIVAHDPKTGEWGIAVASKFLAVGTVVPWAKADVGAIATQSYANVNFGPKGLELLGQGKSAEETLKSLIEADNDRDQRQVGIIDTKGNAANYTGSKCNPWAGAKKGTNYTCQGNLLAGEEVINDMAKAFEESTGPLAWRLMAAMEAGEKAGGDKRGKQAAAIYVVKKEGGYARMNDRYIDFRVDDHAKPIDELARLLALKLPRKKSD